jgi:hypothetical protein
VPILPLVVDRSLRRLDDGGRRIAADDRDGNHLPAGSLHFVATDDLIERVVPALDQDIGHHVCHDRQDARVVENRDIVHGGQGSEDPGTFCFGLKRPSVSLKGAETAVAFHGDGENITEATRVCKQATIYQIAYPNTLTLNILADLLERMGILKRREVTQLVKKFQMEIDSDPKPP